MWKLCTLGEHLKTVVKLLVVVKLRMLLKFKCLKLMIFHTEVVAKAGYAWSSTVMPIYPPPLSPDWWVLQWLDRRRWLPWRCFWCCAVWQVRAAASVGDDGACHRKKLRAPDAAWRSTRNKYRERTSEKSTRKGNLFGWGGKQSVRFGSSSRL